MSLKEDLQEIVWSIDAKFDDNRPSCDSKYYINQILATISKHLPEKRQGLGHGLKSEGFNEAIDEVNKLLTTNKKGEV